MGEVIRLLFWRAAHERERPNFPLYHTAQKKSIGNLHKKTFNLFPEKGLTFTLISSIIRYTQKEGNTSGLQKKSLAKFKKTLDKTSDLWYNKNVPREKKAKREFKRIFKTSKKVLDKLPDLWYNKYIKTRTVLKTRKGLILWKTRK